MSEQMQLLEQVRKQFGSAAATAAGVRAAKEQLQALTLDQVSAGVLRTLEGFWVKAGIEAGTDKIESVFVRMEPRGKALGRVFIPLGWGAYLPYRVIDGQNGLFARCVQESWVTYNRETREPVLDDRGYVKMGERPALVFEDGETDTFFQQVACKAMASIIAAARNEEEEAGASDDIPY